MSKENLKVIVCQASSDYETLDNIYNYIEKLEAENQQLQQKVNQLKWDIESITNYYNDAKELYFKARDKVNQLETNIDEAIHNIKYKENIIKSFPNSIRGIDFSDLISILERGKE